MPSTGSVLMFSSEAAAVTAFYVLVVEVFIYKEISIRVDLPRIMRESMVLIGGIFIILATALCLTNYMILEKVPDRMFDFIRYDAVDAKAELVVNADLDEFRGIIIEEEKGSHIVLRPFDADAKEVRIPWDEIDERESELVHVVGTFEGKVDGVQKIRPARSDGELWVIPLDAITDTHSRIITSKWTFLIALNIFQRRKLCK